MRQINTVKQQGGFSKLMVIIIILVVVLLGAGGAVTFIFVLGGDDEEMIDEEHIGETDEEKEAREKEEGQVDDDGIKKEAKFWSIEPPLVVNYDNFGKKGFLQVAISVMTYNPSVLDRVNKNSPIIRNNLLLLFNGRKYEDLIGSENQLRMQQEALDEVNRVLQEYTGKGGIDNVFFTAYIMQ